MREFALWPSTNVTTIHIWVLAGSQSTITEIIAYIYFNPLKLSRETKHKSEQNIVPLVLIIEPFLFLWNIIFTFYYTRVRPQCDFSIRGRVCRYLLQVSFDRIQFPVTHAKVMCGVGCTNLILSHALTLSHAHTHVVSDGGCVCSNSWIESTNLNNLILPLTHTDSEPSRTQV